MKHDELRSIAHNAAASLASGDSFLVGFYGLNVFEAARESPTGVVVVDFLRGTIQPQPESAQLAGAMAAFPAALPALCKSHGTTIAAFEDMSARYWVTPQGERYTVSVTDRGGHKSETDYGGYDGQRAKTLDTYGRLRPKGVRSTKVAS